MSTAHQRYIQLRKDELYHFNPNHDPKDGKFTSGPGGVSSGSVTSQKSDTFKPRADYDGEKAISKTSIEEHTIKNSIATGGFRITKGDVHDASNKLLAIYKREKIDPRTPGIRAFNDADRINQELRKKCSSGLSNISKETPENKAAIEKAYASSTNVGSLAKDLYQKIQRDSQYSRTDSLGKQYTEKQKTFDEDVKELGRLIREYDDAYFKEFGKRLMIV